MAHNTCQEDSLSGCEVQTCTNHDQDKDKEDADRLECAVCLQPCIHPVQLPCGHIFCYLCVKGVAMVNQSKRCAMCRKELPSGYLEHPNLLNSVDLLEESSCSAAFDDGRQWFYEGHNGWWQYDERTSVELETAFTRGDRVCELLIAGFLYVIDFDGMVQFRRNDPSRRRRIKRDMATIVKKGIAGLRLPGATQEEEEEEEGQEPGGDPATDMVTAEDRPRRRHRRRHPDTRRQTSDRDSDGAEGVEEDGVNAAAIAPAATLNVFGSSSSSRRVVSPAPSAPSNTPQTPHTPSQDSGTSSPTTAGDSTLHDIVQGMQNLLGAITSEDSDSDSDEDEEDDDVPEDSADVGLLVANGDVTDEIL